MEQDFRRMFAAMAKHRRMYVLDDRFLTAVAFVSGCDAATGLQLLAGFGDWLYRRQGKTGHTSIAWPGLLIYERLGRVKHVELTKDQDEQLVVDMFEALDEFLANRKTVFEIS